MVWRKILLGYTILVMIFFLGCSTKSDDPIRIGINAWPDYEFLFMAEELGICEQERLSIKLIEISSLSDARRAYDRKQIDGMACTMIELLSARNRSFRQPILTLLADFSDGADVIITEKLKAVSKKMDFVLETSGQSKPRLKYEEILVGPKLVFKEDGL